MSTKEPDVEPPAFIAHLHDQAEFVAGDIEDHPVVSEKAGRRENCLDRRRALPGSLSGEEIPSTEIEFRILM